LNQAALVMFGYQRWELIGRNINMLMEPKHAKHHDEYLERYRRTLTKRIIGDERSNLFGLKKDGSLFRMVLKVHEYVDGHQRVFLGIISDISRMSQADHYIGMLSKFVPPSICQRLIGGEKQIGEKYRATVGFVELVGFTERVAEQPASIVFGALGEIWSAFDVALEKFACKRVKTIGDLYVFVTQFSETISAHAVNGALMAQHCVDVIKSDENIVHKKIRGLLMTVDPQLKVRVGVSTGDIIAGVVPGDCLSYDILGLCVNEASRLQQLASNSMVLCSERTYHEASYQLKFAEFANQSIRCFEVKGVLESYEGGGIPISKTIRFTSSTSSKND